MSRHKEKAKDLFYQGYNCSQAVAAAFCDVTGMDFDIALKLSSSFGGGMGGLREVCGALSGAYIVAGMLRGYSDPKDKEAKAEHYKLIQEIASRFKEKNGTMICRELLGPSGQADSQRRPCVEYVEQVAQILEDMLKKGS